MDATGSGSSSVVAAPPDRQTLAGKYLTFHLQQEVYGLAILKVQEIIGIMPVTKVPRMPPFVRGVINLRGKIIPVVDLRIQFGLEAQDDTSKTCIIVVQILRDCHKVTMGIIVDEVAEVVDLRDEQIEPPPAFGTTVSTDFLLGMGKLAQKVVMLLDVDRVLASEQVALAEQMESNH